MASNRYILFLLIFGVALCFQNCSDYQSLSNGNTISSNTDTSSNPPTPPTPPTPMPPNNSDWPNKPAHLKTINDTPHSQITQNGWYSVYGIDSIISDSSDPISAPSVLQQRFPAGLVGGNGGGGGSLIGLSKDYSVRYKEFFHGFWMKVDAQWEQHPVFTKISWLHTGFESSVQGNQLFMGLVGPQGGPYSVNANYQNIDIDNRHLNGNQAIGTVRFDPGANAFKIVPGQWAKVEIYWKQSTCDSCKNGVYKTWINGTAGVDVTTLNTGRIGVDSVSYITIWGGTGSVKSRDSYFWVAHSFLAAP